MTGIDLAFGAASLVAVGSAALAVTRRNPVYSAAWMMSALFALAVIFALLESQFLAVVQVLLYAGAILVLFVFVIMLLNPDKKALAQDRPPGWLRALAGVFSAAILVAIARGIFGSEGAAGAAFSAPGAPRPHAGFGEIEWFGRTLYDTDLLAFELVSLLIMAAIAGAVFLGKRRLEGAGERGEDEEEREAPGSRAAAGTGPLREPARPAEEIRVHAR